MDSGCNKKPNTSLDAEQSVPSAVDDDDFVWIQLKRQQHADPPPGLSKMDNTEHAAQSKPFIRTHSCGNPTDL